MSSIFDAYDEEFLALTQDIGNNISHLTTYETDSGGLRGAYTSCLTRFGHPLLFHSDNRTPSTFFVHLSGDKVPGCLRTRTARFCLGNLRTVFFVRL